MSVIKKMFNINIFTAKLHALLNTNSIPAHPAKLTAPMWDQTDESLSEDSRYFIKKRFNVISFLKIICVIRRSTPVPSHIQPPPAHQQSHNSSSRLLGMAYDLKFSNAPKTPTTVTSAATPPQSTGPIDLSSG